MRGPEVPYVERRGSIYRVRFRVPCDLAEQTGLVEIRRSLQTSDLKIAHRRALAARTWFADVVGMLRAKDKSARRLKGQPIHTDTLGHWTELLDHARLEHSKGSTEQLAILIVELESELADRADS